MWCCAPTSMNIRMMMPKKRLNSGTNAFYISGVKHDQFRAGRPTACASAAALQQRQLRSAVGLQAQAVGRLWLISASYQGSHS
jgi:hypothetical protein